jgi:hypothetical protein
MSKKTIKEILIELLNSVFLDSWKTSEDVVKKLSQRGFTIKGKKIGMVNRMLTQMCQDSSTGLEREEIPKEERQKWEKWRYRKVK